MSLVLPSKHEQEIRRHLEECYPDEGCGFLVGKGDPIKEVHRIERAGNTKTENRARRFLIDPADFQRVDVQVRKEGMDIIGIYHSHPDHPARPSEFDREHAWPWYSYIVVAVEKGASKDFTSWVLDEDRSRFISEDIRKEP